MLGAARERDSVSYEHAGNVAALAVDIGEELGLRTRELAVLGFAATVHDVGKAAVPMKVIEKAGPLDAREWTAMRRHPAVGAAMLASSGAPPEVVAAVRSHHERWDGSGYPLGLRGADIPLFARIIAVADAFWAMIEPRPYRASSTAAGARAELLAHAGSQFDVTCARAATRVTAS
jgi:putative nucleotidyltransferase with HDIG domain